MVAMTSKERVRRTLSREVPDRVPIDYCANPGIDGRLKEHFGLRKDDGEGLLRSRGVDFRGVGAPYIGRQLHADAPGRSIDLWGIRRRWIEHESGGYRDFCDFPLPEATRAEVEGGPFPSPDYFDYSRIEAQCDRHKDYCVYAGHAGTGDIINM